VSNRFFPVFLILALSVPMLSVSASEPAECVEDNADPIPVERAAPAYPHQAMMFCLTGSVGLEFTIETSGRVTDIEIIDSTPSRIFERSARRATSQWQFVPRCVDGSPVEHRQRTVIDFELDFEAEDCPSTIDRIDDELTEFIAKLGTSHALMAEIVLHGDSEGLVAELERSLAPEFEGDLGDVESFHQVMIEEMMDQVRAAEHQYCAGYLPLLVIMPGLTPNPDALDRESAGRLRDCIEEQLQTNRDRLEAFKSGHASLEASVDLDEELLDLLISPFFGSIDAAGDMDALLDQEAALVDELLTLFEQAEGSWRVQPQGIVFSNPVQQETYDRLRLALLPIATEMEQEGF